jgi:hypothetical protein
MHVEFMFHPANGSLLDILKASMAFPVHRISVVLVVLSLVWGCGCPPAENASNSDSQKLPFDRQPRSSGVSPSQTLIPSSSKLPEGTGLPVRLQSALSSASSHAGDSFSAALDEPVVIDGQTLLARGTPATGRVLETKPAASSLGGSLETGYLRIVLVSLSVGGRTVMIETSSIFAKGGSREERNAVPGNVSGAAQKDMHKDIVFGVDRRLNFRLAQDVELQ